MAGGRPLIPTEPSFHEPVAHIVVGRLPSADRGTQSRDAVARTLVEDAQSKSDIDVIQIGVYNVFVLK
jgi:hypothetical protein